ncbi:MAG: NAD+ synthase, partial [Candidatus Eisenbacteria bacterium]|nr:NAD+ synthase [Candidatus Eisenbacteria bacterium]
LKSAAEAGAELAVFPEMFLTGYPPHDLLERHWFVERAEAALADADAVSRRFPDTAVLLGTVTRSERPAGKGLNNSAVLLKDGDTLATVHKVLLPTYDVFDEARYFDAAEEVHPVQLGDEVLGVTICEDAWNEGALGLRPAYMRDPVAQLAERGATLFVNISASPFCVGKDRLRYELFSGHASRHGAPFVVVNQVGGNDELVFDGRSAAVAPDGSLLAYCPSFEEDVRVIDTASDAGDAFAAQDETDSIRQALVTGLRDYVRKCGFSKAAVGLSGGIDSAVVAALAVEALGHANVMGVTMPSPYSSPGSIEDSRKLAMNLGIGFAVIPISDVYQSYLDELDPYLGGGEVGVTEENIQARIRGNILMALSNESGYLLLSTGNKSELAVGYCTLYGDMSGGLAVISDVPKTMVYALAEALNGEREVIPRSTIEKPPSAELRPGQKDRDTLPPYETLDRILELYIDGGSSADEIVAEGFSRATVEWVIGAVNHNEYKRRQAAPGLKVTSKAFGMGRRMPIAARYEP